MLPLVMSGIAAAGLLTLALSSAAGRAAGAVAFAVLGGLSSAALAQSWLSVLPGSYFAVSAALALALFAVTGTVTGLASGLGRPAAALGALAMLLLGNPLSAATSAPELLPQPWGAIGQLLPPGAAVTLLRSVAFFEGAASGGPLTVLLIWAAAATALLAAGALRGRSPAEARRADPAMVS